MHFNNHSAGKLPKIKKRKVCVREQRENARKKGSSAKTRVRDINVMKAGMEAYEKALQSGETAEEYGTRKGITKQKISGWRKSIKNKENR